MQALQTRYETALELLGERCQTVSELEQDILEMKEIFHTQLDLMTQQVKAAGLGA